MQCFNPCPLCSACSSCLLWWARQNIAGLPAARRRSESGRGLHTRAPCRLPQTQFCRSVVCQAAAAATSLSDCCQRHRQGCSSVAADEATRPLGIVYAARVVTVMYRRVRLKRRGLLALFSMGSAPRVETTKTTDNPAATISVPQRLGPPSVPCKSSSKPSFLFAYPTGPLPDSGWSVANV